MVHLTPKPISSPYKLGKTKHVFIDWDLVEPGYGLASSGESTGSYEMPYGIQLAVHPPKIDSSPIIKPDRPWESDINSHSTIFKDGNIFRLYYRIWDISGHSTGKDDLRLAYAESDDGKTWVKPNLGTYEFNGSTNNNIINLGRPAGSPMVFKDPSADNNERYKLVFREKHDVFGATSSDGLHWDVINEPLLVNYHADTHNQFMYDESKGKYIGYWRGWEPHGTTMGRRTIAYAETKNFRKWPRPKTIVSPDIYDSPSTDIYTNSYSPWPNSNAHLMFPCMFERDTDLLEMHLMTSRDGLTWNRISRDPIVPSGRVSTGEDASIYGGAGLININAGEWALPISPQAITHNQALYPKALRNVRPHGTICLASWREDGWTSIEAKSEGEFSTSPFLFQGGNLMLNSWSTYGGHIKVEITEASILPRASRRIEMQPIPGKSFDDCDVISNDNIQHIVTWNGSSDISEWAGKLVRLRFKLHRSRIHALWFI